MFISKLSLPRRTFLRGMGDGLVRLEPPTDGEDRRVEIHAHRSIGQQVVKWRIADAISHWLVGVELQFTGNRFLGCFQEMRKLNKIDAVTSVIVFVVAGQPALRDQTTYNQCLKTCLRRIADATR